MVAREAVSVVSALLQNWSSVSCVPAGLVYKQLMYVEKAIFHTESGKMLKTGLVSSSSGVTDGCGNAISKYGLKECFDNILYPPVAILAEAALRSVDGKRLLKSILKSFGETVGVKKVRLLVSKKLSTKKVDLLYDKISKMCNNRVNFSLEVNNDLLDGWTLFVDFWKLDNSIADRLNSLLSSLSIDKLR
ncbi:MAG: F0F1 ATP synthase subunit delta [Alphaproteobacteria bacterium]|nr:F0F1 ATP synthase subunit delta [Rickettsiales bacterium]